jgi:glucokinase
MSEQAVVALDVGGTTVDAACVSADGVVIGELRETSSPAAGTEDEIVNELARVIEAARARAGSAEVTACGVAIPAPFDYVAGVSYMRHKFQAIYGAPLDGLLRAKTGLRPYFVNDGDAFGLGVGWRQLPATKRFIALTIGTGLGSGFIEDGQVIQDERVPPGGEVWDLPFGDGILEDHVSAHAVVAVYDTLRPGERRSAKEIADLAEGGDPSAIEAYRALGAALGAGLGPVLARFAPEKVVIGGHIAQSVDFFRPAMQQALALVGLATLPVIQAAPGNLAIWGAARHALALGAVTRGAGT